MKFIKQKINGVFLIVIKDLKTLEFFSRMYCKKLYEKLKFNPVQTNISYNKKKYFRGFHYQISKSSEKKLVSCFKGKFMTLLLILKKFKTYRKWFI